MTKRTNGHNPENAVSVNFTFLKTLAISNLEFFKTDKNDNSAKFVEYLCVVIDQLDSLFELVEKVSSKTDSYDFSEESRGNGHLSWLKICHKIIQKFSKVLEEVCSSRGSYFFRRDFYLKEIAAYSDGLGSLTTVLKYSLLLMSWCGPGELLPDEKYTCEDLLKSQDTNLNQYCFYGRLLGFQFCDSMATILKALCILMASFSEVYYSDGKILDPIVRGSKYWIDPELRAKRIVNISQYGSADFCKNFWFLGEMELMTRVVPSIVLPSLIVNKVISVDTQPLIIVNVYGKEVDIPVPSSHIGHAPVNTRLLSASLRLGMEPDKSTKSGFKYPSEVLLFHCHGGGFVAQSSRSHENYLRQWAIGLDIPILSVDYSLAPEAPYPRALEEVFYAYCWAIVNASKLGFTGNKIILAGDSAGANLNIGLTMMCLEYGVQPPSGLFLAYVPIMMNLSPSPSRLLCLIDPLLPFGFIVGCFKAYACSSEVYLQSMAHERKLRRNVARSDGGKSEVPPSTASVSSDQCTSGEEEARSDGEEEVKPALSRSVSTGVISRWVESLSSKISSLSPSASLNNEKELDEEMDTERFLACPYEMLKFEVPKDPFISPYLASETVLAKFPPVYLMTTDLDPFLDDCVHFAKTLRMLCVQTHLDILPGLCHGFLNFSLISNEAYEGSKLCIHRIKEVIELSSVEASTPGEEL